jgi:hypothetical protein
MTGVEISLSFVALGLGILNIAQFVFYMVHTHKLLNKLMSKSYYEYALTKKLSKERPEEPHFQTSAPLTTAEDSQVLNDLNAIVPNIMGGF